MLNGKVRASVASPQRSPVHAATRAQTFLYNNYFASREQAIVAAITGEREPRIAAVRIALEGWLRPGEATGTSGKSGGAGLVVPVGSLPDLLRTTLAPLTPAFDAAERPTQP